MFHEKHNLHDLRLGMMWKWIFTVSYICYLLALYFTIKLPHGRLWRVMSNHFMLQTWFRWTCMMCFFVVFLRYFGWYRQDAGHAWECWRCGKSIASRLQLKWTCSACIWCILSCWILDGSICYWRQFLLLRVFEDNGCTQAKGEEDRVWDHLACDTFPEYASEFRRRRKPAGW